MTMDLGVGLPTGGPNASTEAIVRIAQGAEQLGYTAVWTYERLLCPVGDVPQPGGPPRPLPKVYESVFDPIETLAFVAAKTSTIRLATSVIDAPFHLPVVMARRLATLDQLSGGRVIAGLGQAWMDQEFETANITREGLGRRVREFVAAMRAAWGPDPVSFDGRFYTIAASKIGPKPAQAGGIPILMGVAAPPAVRRAAQIADGLNPIGMSLESVTGVVGQFRSEARAAGRDPAALKVMVRANVPITDYPLGDQRPFLGGAPRQIAGDLASLAELDVDHVLFAQAAPSTPDNDLRLLEALQEAAAGI
jgi:probable F420-dependent oxidoreductase